MKVDPESGFLIKQVVGQIFYQKEYNDKFSFFIDISM